MLNKQQPSLKQVDFNSISVHSIFPTIQGEGPFNGVPATFIRLAGCNLACPFCDTDYTSASTSMSPLEAASKAFYASALSKLCVITGGEPCRQYLFKLVDDLIDRFDVVQIETNGTLELMLSPFAMMSEKVRVVCSPKGRKLHNSIAQKALDYKYVIRSGETDPEDGLPCKHLGMDYKVARPPKNNQNSTVWVYPLDEQDADRNHKNLMTAASVAMNYGYRLGVQIHKQAGLL